MNQERKVAKLERRIRLLKKEMKGYEEEDARRTFKSQEMKRQLIRSPVVPQSKEC